MIQFAACTDAKTPSPNALQLAADKFPLPVNDLDPDIIQGAQASQPSERHLDRFSRFCMAHERDKQTDTQTDHPTPSVAIGRI